MMIRVSNITRRSESLKDDTGGTCIEVSLGATHSVFR